MYSVRGYSNSPPKADRLSYCVPASAKLEYSASRQAERVSPSRRGNCRVHERACVGVRAMILVTPPPTNSSTANTILVGR